MMTTGRKPVRVVELTLRKETSGCKFRVWFGDPPCGNWLLAELVIRYVPVGASCVFQAGCACRVHIALLFNLLEDTIRADQPSQAELISPADRDKSVQKMSNSHPPAQAGGFLVFMVGYL